MTPLPPPQIVCLAQVIEAEAIGESETGRRAVAHVVINRSKTTGKSICAVVRQHGQFKLRLKYSVLAYKTACNLGRDPTRGALYFKTRSCRERWPFRLTITIGNHRFYA